MSMHMLTYLILKFYLFCKFFYLCHFEISCEKKNLTIKWELCRPSHTIKLHIGIAPKHLPKHTSIITKKNGAFMLIIFCPLTSYSPLTIDNVEILLNISNNRKLIIHTSCSTASFAYKNANFFNLFNLFGLFPLRFFLRSKVCANKRKAIEEFVRL